MKNTVKGTQIERGAPDAIQNAMLALAASEERFRLTVEHSMDGVVSIGTEGRVEGWSRQSEVIFGWSREEVLGRSFVELIVGTDRAGESDEVLFRSFTHPEALNRRVVIRAVRRGGESFPLEFAWTAIGLGPSVTYIAFVRDITEQHRAQFEIQHAMEAAERANKSKGDFISRMSHELRTPLNAILGFGQLLALEDLGEEANEATGHIIHAGRHLLGLINEILDISQIESGQISLRMGRVRAAEIVPTVVALVQPLADQRGVKLIVPDIDQETKVYADPQRLVQVLLNLLSNGIKYTRDQGSVAISLIEEDSFVHLDVEDDGHGIDPAEMERLFVPFDRLGAEYTKVEGTGLGLSLSKRLVEAMGGDLTVRSRVGEGTTFTVSLPVGGKVADDDINKSSTAIDFAA